MVVNKPPLGWNSWNTYAEKIDEALILESARALKESGSPMPDIITSS